MHCHGADGMGTGLLGRRVQPALLEARDNLPAAYVIVACARASGTCRPIPRGEVSDDQLRQIADYLAVGPHPAATTLSNDLDHPAEALLGAVAVPASLEFLAGTRRAAAYCHDPALAAGRALAAAHVWRGFW